MNIPGDSHPVDWAYRQHHGTTCLNPPGPRGSADHRPSLSHLANQKPRDEDEVLLLAQWQEHFAQVIANYGIKGLPERESTHFAILSPHFEMEKRT